ncbi:hypothetical protein BRADI_4g23325v3 [Brachypodium distachyon]|uniref:Uncharacterized protein n=1 Tax=Brachypodium distachyon TaxID=15368 RepID=A0A2K2CPM3_BRADI|nr:hypothetical protein BRADI_4g23325v3 [Brachypodium distachyon]
MRRADSKSRSSAWKRCTRQIGEQERRQTPKVTGRPTTKWPEVSGPEEVRDGAPRVRDVNGPEVLPISLLLRLRPHPTLLTS